MSRKIIVVTAFLISIFSGSNYAGEKWYHASFSGCRNFGNIKMADAKGEMVWIVTDSGLASIDLSTMRVEKHFLKFMTGVGTTPSNQIRNLWVLDSKNALVTFRDNSNYDYIRTMKSDSVFIMAPHNSYFFDAVTRNRKGILIGAGYDPVDAKVLYRYADSLISLPLGTMGPIKGNITNLIEDSNGKIWLTCDSSLNLYYYDSMGVKPYPIEMHSPVSKMLYDTNGGVIIVTADVLLAVSSGQLKEIGRLGDVINGAWSIVDKNNNFWYWSRIEGQDYLNKMSVGNPNDDLFKVLDTSGPLFDCGRGIGIAQSRGLKIYPTYKDPSMYISLETQLWNTCGFSEQPSELLFRKDGSLLILLNTYPLQILQCKNNKCNDLTDLVFTSLSSAPWSEVESGWSETESGKLFVPAYRCLYVYDGNSWDSIQVPFKNGGWVWNYLIDDKNRIWNMNSASTILKYENKEWFWIDSSNSNFSFGQYYSKFYLRKDGAIVACFGNGKIGTTFDGYHWSFTEPIFTGDSDPIFVYTLQNSEKTIIGWTLENCNQDWRNCFNLGRYVYDGNVWKKDKTVAYPEGLTKISQEKMFEDCKGNLWIPEDMYRFNGSDWLNYNQSNAPFKNAHLLGEDPYTGNIYAYETEDGVTDIYILDRDSLNLKEKRKVPLKKFSGLSVKNCGKGNLSLFIDLECQKTVSIKLYTLQGKLIRKLYEGQLSRGINERIFDINILTGVYVVRISSKERSDFLQATVRLLR